MISPASLRSLPTLLVAVVVLLGASGVAAAAQTDVIRGRVVNPEGLPLVGVRVTATSIPGGVTRETRTNPDGNFQIVFPSGTGDYMMGYGLVGYQYRQTQVKRLADEEVLIADARLSIVELDPVVVTATIQDRVSRAVAGQDVGVEQTITIGDLAPEAAGDLAAMAASLPGVVLVPGVEGEPDGFSVLGLGSDENSVTLNGLPLDSNRLPRDAGVSTSLSTSPFDVSRGGFSGANLNITSRPGSNFRSRGVSLVTTTPQMQWTDRAAQALANEYTNVSLSGTLAGPISFNRSFYNLSYQLGRQARDNPTLLDTDPIGLLTAGLAPDSVARFLGILQGRGVPTGAGSVGDRLSDSGSIFGSIDFSPPSSASGQSFGVTFNGNWSQLSALGSGPTQLPSSSSDRVDWTGGVQARHSGYLGMILTETSLGFNRSREYVEPYLELPSGQVQVSSELEDGASGVRTLSFGGSQTLSSSKSGGITLQNSLSWFDDANRHRIKLGTELQYRTTERERSSNLYGTFAFNSLADLEAGRPASFTRTLSAPRRSSDLLTGAVSLGDAFRARPSVQIQYGVRFDFGRFGESPEPNPLVESRFGRRNDRLPTQLEISPRIGFSWTMGRAQQIASFVGAASAPRAVVQGGIGLFANGFSPDQVLGALENTGLARGAQQITCVGPTVPIPDWERYLDDPAAIPDSCADGSSGSVFSNRAPNVTLFGEGYRPPRSVRANLSWRGGVLDSRFNLSLAGTYSHNLDRQRFVDLNFDSRPRFTVPGEDRPVFVEPSSIVPSTGSVAAAGARLFQDFSRVSELRSDLESRSAQLSVNLSPIPQGQTRFRWNAGYTYSHVREQLSGFTTTAGDPLTVEWTRSAQGPHQINYSLGYNFFDAVQVTWSGSFRSGNAFTPMVAGDVNGDGYGNDRAFIHDPSGGGDPAVAAGMRDLLESASPGIRECLETQIGAIAAPNSCRAPWSSSAALSVTLDRAKFRMPQRGSISFSLSNPLGAADLLLNGSGDLKGWGQTPMPDAALLYVRGFDPATREYRYEVNERFGASRPQATTFRNPVTLTASLRFDLGPTRERQQLGQQLASGRSRPGSRAPDAMFRAMGTGSLLNPMAAILRTQDTLQLSTLQADSIAAMNRRYTYRADSLWTPTARYLGALPDRYSESQAYAEYLQARRAQVDMLAEMGPAIRELLTPEQRRKLPAQVANAIDPRYLALIRDGTGTYVGTGAGGPGPVPGLGAVPVAGAVLVERAFEGPAAGGGGPVIIIRGPGSP